MDIFEKLGYGLMLALGALSALIMVFGGLYLLLEPIIIWGAGG